MGRWRGLAVGVAVLVAGTGVVGPPAGADPAPGARWRATGDEVGVADGHLFLDGADGDYLTAERDHLKTTADHTFTVVVDSDDNDELEVDVENPGPSGDLHLAIRPPDGTELTTGFTWIGRGTTGEGGPRFRLGMHGRGCNWLGGWLSIDELAVTDDVVEHVALRFGVRCERYMPVTYGQLRWSAPPTVDVAPPTGVAPTATADGASAAWTPSDAAGVTGYRAIVAVEGRAVARQDLPTSATSAAFAGLPVGARASVVVHALTESGVGPRSAASPHVVVGQTGADAASVALVEQLYRDLLGRPSDPGGRSYWVARLGSGARRSTVTLALARSNEARRRSVEHLFTTLQARRPTSAELDAYAPWLVGRGGREAISALILGSAERLSHFERTQEGWDQGVFWDLRRRRTGSGQELETVQELMVAGRLREAARLVIDTLEARGHAVDDLYVRLLGRHGDRSGVDYWVTQMLRGRTFEHVVAAITASPEYAARAARL